MSSTHDAKNAMKVCACPSHQLSGKLRVIRMGDKGLRV